MKKRLITWTVVCVTVMSLLLTACGPASDPNAVIATGVSISGTGVNNGVLNLVIGGRDIPLSATVRPSNATDKTIAWESSDKNVVTVSAEGLLHIVGEGTATVTAKCGDVSDSITVNVSATVDVTSVSFSEESYEVIVPTNDPGMLDLTPYVTVLPDDAANKNIVWSIAPADSMVTVNAQGVVIASSMVDMSATYTVTATSAANADISASTTITFGRTPATGIVVRLSSNGAQKPASYVYEFNLDDSKFEHLVFVAENRPVGSAGTCVFTSSNPAVCDIISVDELGNPVESSGQAKLQINGVGEAVLTVSIKGTDVSKKINVKINPAAGYVIDGLNVLPSELQSVVDYSAWWDFATNPVPKNDSLFYSVLEPAGNLGLFFSGMDGTNWNSKMNINQGNNAYVEDGGYCTVFTPWDWPLDNNQTNGYIFNTVHVPAGATTFRAQLRTQSGQYVSGMAKVRIRMVDKNDLSQQIFLDVNGQTVPGFAAIEGRPVEDKVAYENGAFDPTNGWFIIPGVPDYNIGEDIYFCTIPEAWRDRDVIIFIECDALYESDGMGHMIEGKNDQLLICNMGFVSNANNPAEFVPNHESGISKIPYITSGIHELRDPCVFVENGVYYMCGTGWHLWKNETGKLDSGWVDLGCVVEIPADAGDNYWAPEIHYYNGYYYMFTTYLSKTTGRHRCTILRSDKLEGMYREITTDNLTPLDWDCIDGTLYVDNDGQPWLVFVHEWVSMPDKVGTMAAAKLSSDLTHLISEPVELFRADAPAWAVSGVTDGCWLYRCEDGQLLMLWSNFDSAGYCVGISRSVSGDILGEWIHDPEPLYSKNLTGVYDGGHGMIFTDLNGQMYLSIHSPNSPAPGEGSMPIFVPVKEENGTLVVDM